ncbi:MAG: hypothetical protein V9E83_11455 [Baekduia sp.]
MSVSERAVAQEPVTVSSAAGLGPVQSSWDDGKGQFVPSLPSGADGAARRAFGARFAGLHYWRAEGSAPVLAIHLVGGSAADEAAVRALIATGALGEVRTPVRIVPAAASERELRRGVRAIATRIGREITGAGIDTLRNQVVLTSRRTARAADNGVAARLSPTPSERRLGRDLGLPGRAIRWEAGAPARPLALSIEMSGIYGGTRIFLPVAGTNSLYLCTAGWAFTASYGRFMTTAGHCGPPGRPVLRSFSPDVQISAIRASAYNTTSGDIADYPAAFASARQYVGGNDIRYVQAASSPRVGEWVCFYGASSQQYSCGSVSIVGRTYVPSGFNGARVGHQFCTVNQGPNSGGDSGAAVWIPWFQNDQRKISLRGTLSAGGPGLICATDASVTLLQSAALPATETPPCS